MLKNNEDILLIEKSKHPDIPFKDISIVSMKIGLSFSIQIPYHPLSRATWIAIVHEGYDL